MPSYSPRILIVDDEPHICESLRVLLKRQGYEIFTANGGRKALEVLERQAVDLLLLDMVMPDMSGSQVMDYVNKNHEGILTIVITGNASIDSAITSLRKGAYDYLKKPFEYDELLKRVGNALEQKRLAREKEIIGGKLELSEERYQMLVQNSPDMIYVLDDKGKFVFVNSTVRRLLGFDVDRLIGQPFISIVHDDDIAAAEALLKQKSSGRKSETTTELKLKTRSGELFKLFELSHEPIDMKMFHEGEENPGIQGVALDITYHKKLERQLQNAKKMEAIGTLSSGIAHDFNNILMGIMGYTSLLLAESDSDSPVYRKLQSIEQHVHSGANLTKQLLSFARGGKYDIRPADMNTIVEKTASMFGRSKKEISINSTVQKGLWSVEVDAGQFEQVLLNLYMNAWQAMPDGGSISIRTENVTVDAPAAKHLDLSEGRYVKVSVGDTGIGMDEETRQRIFEPFFTTKGMDRGTGLGLASAYGIIVSHGGGITVESRKAKGTTFFLYIPASDKPVEKDDEVNVTAQRGTETILVVDDEESMIEVDVEILETLGYCPLAARSGKEALEIYAEKQQEIDLVIVDLIMPGMGGGELCGRLREFDPEARILLSSGYSLDEETENILERSCSGFIQKPFAVNDLSVKIRAILDG